MDAAASFLNAVREKAIPLRGRVKKGAQECLRSFRSGLLETYPEAEGKYFVGPVSRLWIRWLAAEAYAGDPLSFSYETGKRAGEALKEEYREGSAGNLAAFLLDKRIHLIRVRDYLSMIDWLRDAIENLRRSRDPGSRERAEMLNANFSSIVLRALHNAGPGYAAQAVDRLALMMRDIDAAARNLESTEPEAARFLRTHRATVITRALHSGIFDVKLPL